MDDESSLEEVKTKSLSLGLRLVIGVIAVIFIAVLAISYFPEQSDEAQSEIVTTGSTEAAIAPSELQSAEENFHAGNAYYEARQWDQAIAAYQKAIELDPNYQAAYANLGVTYYQQQQFDLAASQYEKALELNPKDGEVAYNLGVLYLQQALSQGGEPNPELLSQAVSQLQLANEMSPELAEPYFSLGVAYFALNQSAEAKQAFDTFLSLDSAQDTQAKQEAERYLRMLQGQ